MSPGPRQGPLERGAGAFGASPIELKQLSRGQDGQRAAVANRLHRHYENWNMDLDNANLDEDGVGDDLWDFGNPSQYPTLRHGS